MSPSEVLAALSHASVASEAAWTLPRTFLGAEGELRGVSSAPLLLEPPHASLLLLFSSLQPLGEAPSFLPCPTTFFFFFMLPLAA